MSVVCADSGKENLADVLMRMIRSHCLSEVTSTIDTYEDPIAVGSAFQSAMKRLYREHQDVTNMLVAGEMGLVYCLKKAALETDQKKAWELRKLGQAIAFNTAVNCWPGWGDAGVAIDGAHLTAAIKIAAECLNLTQELALKPRAQGTAHWLIGALELAAGRFGTARAAFEQAERMFLADETASSQALMARGYIALARKADPLSRPEGANALNIALDQLRLEGSKDAIFFADQIDRADHLLLEK